jgi:hypothetical protein
MPVVHPNMPCLEFHPPAPTAGHLLAPIANHPPAPIVTHPPVPMVVHHPTAVKHLSTMIHLPTILRRIMARGHDTRTMICHQLVLVCQNSQAHLWHIHVWLQDFHILI